MVNPNLTGDIGDSGSGIAVCIVASIDQEASEVV